MPTEVLTGIAAQVGGFLWQALDAEPGDDEEGDDEEGDDEEGDDEEGDDGTGGVLVPTG